MSETEPTVGRIVHYYYNAEGAEGLPYAAIITGTWPSDKESRVDLCIFTNQRTKKGRAETEFHPAVPFSDKPADGCWTWPPKT